MVVGSFWDELPDVTISADLIGAYRGYLLWYAETFTHPMFLAVHEDRQPNMPTKTNVSVRATHFAGILEALDLLLKD